jgi:hypothetical protein
MSENTTETEVETKAKAARQKVEVTMANGRVVSFSEGTKAQKELITEGDAVVGVRFDFVHGDSRELKLSDLPAALIAHAAAHGLAQKLGDSYASKKVGPEDAVQAIDKIIEALKNGDWSIRSADVGESMAGIGVLTVDCAQVYSVTIEQAKDTLKGFSTKEKAAMRAQPEIAAAIQKIEAERLAKSGGVDADALRARFAPA